MMLTYVKEEWEQNALRDSPTGKYCGHCYSPIGDWFDDCGYFYMYTAEHNYFPMCEECYWSNIKAGLISQGER